MANATIKKIHAREILDSRGNPTVAVDVELSDGIKATASVPSGASTGIHEALELRDGGKRYNGKGVKKAVNNVNTHIAKALKGMPVTSHRKIDETMITLDGTPNKKRLGANAILGVSLAVAHAAAKSKNQPLYRYLKTNYRLQNKYRMPYPMMNIINGGQHATNSLSVQEYMIVPKQRKFKERVRAGSEIFHTLKKLLAAEKLSTGVGDEGGFAPNLRSNVAALEIINKAIKKAGYHPGKDVFLANDIAASEFFNKKRNDYEFRKGCKPVSPEAMGKELMTWPEKYNVISIEDPYDQDAWEDWQTFTQDMKKKILIVGDDLFVTNVERLKKGIEMGVSNAILIKLNQIGSISETIDAIKLAQKNKMAIIVSHRSGETCDTTIADLAVAVGSEYIKTGSLSRSERVGKYNRLMQIQEELGL